MSHFVDTTKKPRPENVGYHNTSLGIVDASKVSLQWSSLQYRGPRGPWQEDGMRIYEDMRSESLNANVLDYLLEHPDLIPRRWKKYCVVFWGTTFRDTNNDLCVGCLGFYKALNKWGIIVKLVDDYFGPSWPAAYPRQSWKDIAHKIIDRF